MPKTHAGTHRQFAVRFVSTGDVARPIGQILPNAFRMRLRGDYDAFAVTDIAAATDLLADAERFVAAVKALVA